MTTSPTIDIAIDNLVQSPFNRKVFNDEYLKGLAADIKVNGILQALTVRQIPHVERIEPSPGYQIIIGEHRWRAAKKAGLTNVPCRVIEATDSEVVLLQLSENKHHNRLNALDEAASYYHLKTLGLDIPTISKRVGMSTAHVYAYLALNSCGDVLRSAVRDGKISGSHAARLQSVDESEHAAYIQRIVRDNMSVRELEVELKRKANAVKGAKQRAKMDKHKPKAKIQQLNDHAEKEIAWRAEVARQILKKISKPSTADIADLATMEIGMVNAKNVKLFKPRNVGQKIALSLFEWDLNGWNKPKSLLALAKRYKVDVKKIQKQIKSKKAKGAK